jgi:hypothetical protein
MRSEEKRNDWGRREVLTEAKAKREAKRGRQAKTHMPTSFRMSGCVHSLAPMLAQCDAANVCSLFS